MVIISGFIIDAAPIEDHTLESATTEHPIEEGADVTDHVRLLPERVVIEGIVTDTPIGVMASIRANETSFAGSKIPSNDAYNYLKKIRKDKRPVTIETSLGRYENMVLLGINVPKNAQTGDALRFRATFQQVEIVKTERSSTRVATPTAQKKEKRGAKSSPPVEDSKALDRQRQLQNKMRKNFGFTHNPTLGTDLL